mmetsp:Transcript_129374/g.346968  ORF Transcript_129374/g.346968 Transcript_129374/m.346968 type:complete len:294 (+) Transcript_129374:422-1303(+)
MSSVKTHCELRCGQQARLRWCTWPHCRARRQPLCSPHLSTELAHLPDQIDGRLTLFAQLEGHRVEVIWDAGGQINLDAAEQAQVAVPELGVDGLHHAVLDHIVGLVGQRGHRILGPRDGLGVGCDLTLAEVHLHVVARRVRAVLGPAAATRVVGADHRPARRGDVGLALARDLAHLAILGDADVGPEGDQDVALVGDVAGERPEASLARERCAADAAHGEHLAPVVLQVYGHAVRLIVDLVRAERGAQQGVLDLEAVLLQDLQGPAVDRLTGKGTGEELVQRLVHGRLRGRAP